MANNALLKCTTIVGLILCFSPIIVLTASCFYFYYDESSDALGNPVSCHPSTHYVHFDDGSVDRTDTTKLPCGAPGADSKCESKTDWQRDVDNLILTTIIFGGTLFGLMSCITCCLGIDFLTPVFGTAFFGGVVASALVIVIITMAFFALAPGRVCRGFYLDEIAGSGIENYEPI